ncbi:alanine--glyoxylate aminotransferase 2, mitochondrial [Condylostylus longicornis]|uniref:alanine--glyoxylate aminotransferase 2, mitochondrial n=1 Tax=Condylostylus longicornis TaxID=2530218 RepID=UPI00244DB513|nr:alanine--glyoxylate aminotransferase 2, mitochondrial [Condylostylus longicornis]
MLFSKIIKNRFSCSNTVRSLSTIGESNFKPPQYEGPTYEEILHIKKQHLTPNILSYYKKPLLIHSGHMQWLYDHTGKNYLDLFGGIVTVSVGHCHPKITKALEEQIKKLWHTTNIYMHPKIHEYAEKLTSKFPGDLKVVYFVNSGSEANDLAILLSRIYTGNFDILSFQNAYHGMSPSTMGLTAHSTWRYKLPGANLGIHHVMNPDPFSGIWGGSNCRNSIIQTLRQCECTNKSECMATTKYYKQLENVLKYSLPQKNVAALFAESIQGVGGTVQFTKGYIKKAAELVRTNGGLLISDEVQTGFGRTGEHFWGFQDHDVIPDIVTMAKGIGNGFPLAAVVTTPKIAKCLNQAFHFNTYGGNPLASAVGIAVLDVIEHEKLQENSAKVGTYFLKQLAKLRDKYMVIGDVRGKGLMIGVELVNDRDSNSPLSIEHVLDIWEKIKDLGVLIGRGGLYGNVFRIKPPMCISIENVDMAIEIFDKVLYEFEKGQGKI